MEPTKIILGIHDLHPWGGQERSNLEIFYRINQHIPIDIHAYTFSDNRTWPQAQWVPYSSAWSRPTLLKCNHYALTSALKLKNYASSSKRKQERIIIQSTGTALPIADVIQVQFVHRTWQRILSQLTDKPPLSIAQQTNETLFAKYNLIEEKILYTNKKKYIAISHGIKKELIEFYNIHPNHIDVIYHGVDTKQFTPYTTDTNGLPQRQQTRRSLNISDDHFVLLSVGALNVRKGLFAIFHAVKELVHNGFDNIILLAVGAGDKEQLIQKAKELKIENSIRIVEPQKNIVPFYQASDIFVFPSIYEPFGLVIFEALACGLPVVTSKFAGASELITHGVDGWLLSDSLNASAIGSDLAQIIKNKPLLNSLSREGRHLAEQNSWDMVAEQYLKYYNHFF